MGHRAMKSLVALLGLLWALPVAGQGYPYFPPPGIGYSATNGNLTLQNLTLESVTGIVLCDGSSGLCSAAVASNIIPLWTGTPSSTQALGSLGALISVGSVTGIAITVPAPLTATSCTITTSGTCAITWTTGEPANEFLATPNGSSGPVGLRAIVAPDLPNLGAAPTATVGPTATTGTASTYIHSDGAPAICLTCSFSWSGTNFFAGAISTSNATTGMSAGTAGGGTDPDIEWINSSGGTDSKVWDCFADTLVFHCRVVNDAHSAAADWLALTRNGVAVSSATLNIGNLTVDASPFGTTMTVGSLSGGDAFCATVTSGSAAQLCQGWATGLDLNAWNLYTSSTDNFSIGAAGTGTLRIFGGGTDSIDVNTSTTTLNSSSIVSNATTVPWCNSGQGSANCPAGTLGTATFNLTSAGAGTPTISHCRGCSSPSISRVATGEWEMNTGVTLATTMAAVCNVSAATGVTVQALFVYAAAADPTADIVMINFFTATNTLADPASGVQVSCIVGS
jgi:hypothetical protein